LVKIATKAVEYLGKLDTVKAKMLSAELKEVLETKLSTIGAD